MTHTEAESLFPAYNKSLLDRGQTRAFHAHLKECEACQARVRLQSTWARSKSSLPSAELTSPETQKAIARNRDLLIKILLMMVIAWAATRLKR